MDCICPHGIFGAFCSEQNIVSRQTQHITDFYQHLHGDTCSAPLQLCEIGNADIQFFRKFLSGIAHLLTGLSNPCMQYYHLCI